jgi:glycosyltransferase involved in cell wall biosynthesis
VATKSGGPEEIIDDHQTGLLVPVGGIQAMAEAMWFLMKNPARAEKMAAEGYIRSRIKFDREFINESIRSAYNNALKKGIS